MKKLAGDQDHIRENLYKYTQSFSPAVPITTSNQDGAYTWEGNFVVAPGGNDLYLVYTRRAGPAVECGQLRSDGHELVARAVLDLRRDVSLLWD